MWCDWNSGLEEVITGYFRNIFTSQAGSPRAIIDLVPTIISDSQNEELCLPYTREEVRVAVFSMQAEKSPGLDGFNPGFYRKYWSIIGDQVADFCINCLHTGNFPQELNETALVLIPKKEQVEKVIDLRPIALCQVLYKIISKMVANRLKLILPEIISSSQGAFVPGRHIPENTVIAYETLHYMRGKRRGKDGYAALKIDVSKAYDRLEWSFMTAMLLKLGFSAVFVEFLLLCVSTSFIRADYWRLLLRREG